MPPKTGKNKVKMKTVHVFMSMTGFTYILTQGFTYTQASPILSHVEGDGVLRD